MKGSAEAGRQPDPGRALQPLRRHRGGGDQLQVETGPVQRNTVLLCRYAVHGCRFSVPSVRQHEVRGCSYRPSRCPSLTCQDRPAAARLADHITALHSGSAPGRDVVVRTGSNRLNSSYVNMDR